jgi:hypothetical protein
MISRPRSGTGSKKNTYQKTRNYAKENIVATEKIVIWFLPNAKHIMSSARCFHW